MKGLCFLYIVYSTISVNVFYAADFYKFNWYSDIWNYYYGYTVIERSHHLFPHQTYFGHFPEIFFVLLYRFISLFELIKSPRDLLIFHSITFSFLYCLMCYQFTKAFFPKGFLPIFIFLLGSSLPGLPLQLSRQAISFALIMLAVSLAIRFLKTKIIYVALLQLISTPFFHLGSSLNFLNVMAIKRPNVYFLFLNILALASTLFYFYVGSFNYVSNIFQDIVLEPFINKNLNFILFMFFILMLFNVPRLKLIDCLVLAALVVAATFPFFALSRVFFGYDFFFVPVSTYLFSTLRNFKHRSNLFIIFGILASFGKAYVFL